MKKILALVTLSCSLLAVPAAEAITLTDLGRTPALGPTQAEIAAFDPDSERAFVTNAGANRLDIYDFSDPSAPTLIESVSLAPYGAGPNSVDVSRKGLVAVAVESAPVTAPGKVVFFDTDGDYRGDLPAGSLPDMVTFAEHDRYVLVANEGEALSNADDPEGSVTVIRLDKRISRSQVRTARFNGVPRFGNPRIACPGTPFEQDAEPEYIAPTGRGTALVTLQEANAVGYLNVERGRFEYVRGLGYKDHGLERNALDPSDRDGPPPKINPWPHVYGMYQPDAIAAYSHRGVPLFVTANEGDARERAGCLEEARASTVMDPTAFPVGAALPANLGRLNVSRFMGNTDSDPQLEQLYAFGARSLSILGPLGGVLYDSGSELEDIAAAEQPSIFNASNTEPAVFDDRSDNKGPEPEGVDVGTVRGDTYAFVASERQGALYAYELNGASATFEDYLNTRPADLGPEGVRFVPREDSPTRHPLLLVTNEVSGTVAAIEVRP